MVKSYVNSCTNCTHNKAPHHKPYGKLKQLPIPDKLWNSISMDFIEYLPAANGFTTLPNSHYSSLPMTPSTPPNLPNYSLPTSSRNMGCHCMSPLIRAPNSYLTSSTPLANCFRWSSISPQDIIQKVMAKPNTSIRYWNST